MINEKKVILMTKLASYEEKQGQKIRKVHSYYRGDYVVVQIFKSFLAVTVAFAIVFGLYVLYDFDVFMQDIYKIDLLSFAKNVLTYYLVALGAYALITLVISTIKYYQVRRSLNIYYKNLNKLTIYYNRERRK
ncbi:MAG: hypothetical protein IKO03_14775 [Lachnospiraceae bacterium]|nr:hypothetical protein [Lachnospiraceae bacterium]MBR4605442.1 hypothetical protein [Lachnospiraceae bacterium]MBR6149666.1 hypothetical protein [Lachnospiraceae bacterium]